MRTGMGMQEGMGMMQQSGPLSEENGPSLGRALGLGGDHEKATTNMPLASQNSMPDMGNMQGMTHMPGSANAARVPGYPQDMSMMPMDEAVAKPETYGLAPGWSGGVTGMMTLVRVLPSDLYQEVTARMKKRA